MTGQVTLKKKVGLCF